MKKKKKTSKTKNSGRNSDSDDDDTFYYRYASVPPPPPSSSLAVPPSHLKNPSSAANSGIGGSRSSSSSSTLAPSKSTLYVSNLDYSLTNSDLHTLFSTFGKIARVSVLKHRETRLSRGVAFIQFVSRNDAVSAARQMHGKILNGRTLTASIAADNGRAPEFIRKRVYRDKSRCYECGDEGHLSYECPKNQLGPRERPVPKRERRGGGGGGGGRRSTGGNGGFDDDDDADDTGDGEQRFEDDNWASVVDSSANERLLKGNEGVMEGRKKMKKAAYFSDESDGEDE